ncbi:hypothetical protein [uncultured Clostridium sp.]|uniref:hypothetical protein n=1 Tax=uncultured Clostridium sp. TaxID=59620 RepID=UPI0026396843|nr:hypothetical protein [uncultured Clostridium sp.]
MILDFIAKANNISYNIKLAKLFGINSAIFLGILIDYNCTRTSEEDYIKLSRSDIYNLTGIDESTQIQTEDNLKYYNLIEVVPLRNSSFKNYYKLKIDNLIHVVESDSKVLQEELNKTYELYKQANKDKEPKSVSKRASIIKNLKNNITIQDQECKLSLESWVDNIMQKLGYLSKEQVCYMCDELNKYSKNSITVLRILCKTAARIVYKDPKWVIKNYEDNYQDNKNNLILNNLSQEEINQNIEELKNYKGETF